MYRTVFKHLLLYVFEYMQYVLLGMTVFLATKNNSLLHLIFSEN